MPRQATKPRRARRTAGLAKRTTASSKIAHHAIAYIVTFVGEVLRTTSLDVLDVLITLTISSANAEARPGMSRSAISRALDVPLETVRRRDGVLLEKRVIRERSEGLFVPELSPLGALDNHAELLALNAGAVRRLFRDLKATGVRLG